MEKERCCFFFSPVVTGGTWTCDLSMTVKCFNHLATPLTAHVCQGLINLLCHRMVVHIYIEDCEGWWFSGCHGSVAEHWWLKLEVSWVWLPATAGLDWVNKANKCPVMEEVLARRVTCWVSSHSIASLYWHLTLFWCVRNSSQILLAILVIKHRLKFKKSLLREMGYMWQKHNKVYLVST